MSVFVSRNWLKIFPAAGPRQFFNKAWKAFRAGFRPGGLNRKAVCLIVAVSFIFSLAVPPSLAQVLPNLPALGQGIGLTPVFQPPILRGMTIHPENPLLFDFIVDRGQDKIQNDQLKGESEKLIKYFLASMTIPDKDAWVNLSPYEKDRIVPDALGRTEMGRVMLEQDYVLKQLAASLTNPETELGARYWAEVERRTTNHEQRSTNNGRSTFDIPRSTFSKVWIIPDGATVVEKDGFAYITESKLKVMLEEDYEALQRSAESRAESRDLAWNVEPASPVGGRGTSNEETLDVGRQTLEKTTTSVQRQASNVSTEVFREMILPKLIEEVNTGKNFAATRQVYQSVILASWYKRALKDSLLGRIYADKSKTEGVETDVKDIKQKVYDQYLETFKKGVYNVIQEENGPDGETIPRKYFSGGQVMNFLETPINVTGNASLVSREELNQAVIVKVFNAEKLGEVSEISKNIIADSSSAVAVELKPLINLVDHLKWSSYHLGGQLRRGERGEIWMGAEKTVMKRWTRDQFGKALWKTELSALFERVLMQLALSNPDDEFKGENTVYKASDLITFENRKAGDTLLPARAGGGGSYEYDLTVLPVESVRKIADVIITRLVKERAPTDMELWQLANKNVYGGRLGARLGSDLATAQDANDANNGFWGEVNAIVYPEVRTLRYISAPSIDDTRLGQILLLAQVKKSEVYSYRGGSADSGVMGRIKAAVRKEQAAASAVDLPAIQVELTGLLKSAQKAERVIDFYRRSGDLDFFNAETLTSVLDLMEEVLSTNQASQQLLFPVIHDILVGTPDYLSLLSMKPWNKSEAEIKSLPEYPRIIALNKAWQKQNQKYSAASAVIRQDISGPWEIIADGDRPDSKVYALVLRETETGVLTSKALPLKPEVIYLSRGSSLEWENNDLFQYVIYVFDGGITVESGADIKTVLGRGEAVNTFARKLSLTSGDDRSRILIVRQNLKDPRGDPGRNIATETIDGQAFPEVVGQGPDRLVVLRENIKPAVIKLITDAEDGLGVEVKKPAPGAGKIEFNVSPEGEAAARAKVLIARGTKGFKATVYRRADNMRAEQVGQTVRVDPGDMVLLLDAARIDFPEGEGEMVMFGIIQGPFAGKTVLAASPSAASAVADLEVLGDSVSTLPVDLLTPSALKKHHIFILTGHDLAGKGFQYLLNISLDGKTIKVSVMKAGSREPPLEWTPSDRTPFLDVFAIPGASRPEEMRHELNNGQNAEILFRIGGGENAVFVRNLYKEDDQGSHKLTLKLSAASAVDSATQNVPDGQQTLALDPGESRNLSLDFLNRVKIVSIFTENHAHAFSLLIDQGKVILGSSDLAAGQNMFLPGLEIERTKNGQIIKFKNVSQTKGKVELFYVPASSAANSVNVERIKTDMREILNLIQKARRDFREEYDKMSRARKKAEGYPEVKVKLNRQLFDVIQQFPNTFYRSEVTFGARPGEYWLASYRSADIVKNLNQVISDPQARDVEAPERFPHVYGDAGAMSADEMWRVVDTFNHEMPDPSVDSTTNKISAASAATAAQIDRVVKSLKAMDAYSNVDENVLRGVIGMYDRYKRYYEHLGPFSVDASSMSFSPIVSARPDKDSEAYKRGEFKHDQAFIDLVSLELEELGMEHTTGTQFIIDDKDHELLSDLEWYLAMARAATVGAASSGIVVFVEDEMAFQAGIEAALAAAGYTDDQYRIFTTMREAAQNIPGILEKSGISRIFVDRSIRGEIEDGDWLVRNLYETGIKVPVTMMTSAPEGVNAQALRDANPNFEGVFEKRTFIQDQLAERLKEFLRGASSPSTSSGFNGAVNEVERIINKVAQLSKSDPARVLAVLQAKGITRGVIEILYRQRVDTQRPEVAIAGLADQIYRENFDSQMAGSSPLGGIDFDPSKLDLQIKRDGRGVPLPLPQQDLENININGLYPVIINILPVTPQTLPFLSEIQTDSPVQVSKT